MKQQYNDNRICILCEHSSALADDSVCLCRKRGVVSASHSCGKFTFDPIKYNVSPRKSVKVPKFNFDKVTK